MNFKYSHVRSIRNRIRFLSVYKTKNYYESLGISSVSTQGEVKSAYYKLSMLYHPDKNQGDMVSAEKFRDITEAYKVLGNVKTRKLYDKGLYFKTAPTTAETAHKFYNSHTQETRYRPPPTGRTPIYDFDEWSRNHYGSTFQRRMDSKRREHMYKMSREQEKHDSKLENMLYVFILILCISTVYNKSSSDKYDRPNQAITK